MPIITLSQALPFIIGMVAFLLGIIAYFLKRNVEGNDEDHKNLREDIDHAAEKNNSQHAELYERLRNVELTLSVIKAQHDQNHD